MTYCVEKNKYPVSEKIFIYIYIDHFWCELEIKILIFALLVNWTWTLSEKNYDPFNECKHKKG